MASRESILHGCALGGNANSGMILALKDHCGLNCFGENKYFAFDTEK